MICDLLNLISLPCLDVSKYLNKQKQIKDILIQSQTNKQVSLLYNWQNTGEQITDIVFI